ncbi:unnamed protein product [Pleuronectes platessa]|uniref:Uncharacterized protein n=1 Tax=Pleuronectes platessa TaxID=8262 RepID=A0A9N7VK91_PLEPL|nr:unnamed protein product [Pleuronectes platessa]
MQQRPGLLHRARRRLLSRTSDTQRQVLQFYPATEARTLKTVRLKPEAAWCVRNNQSLCDNNRTLDESSFWRTEAKLELGFSISPQRHFGIQTRGAGDQTNPSVASGRPSLPPEPQPEQLIPGAKYGMRPLEAALAHCSSSSYTPLSDSAAPHSLEDGGLRSTIR